MMKDSGSITIAGIICLDAEHDVEGLHAELIRKRIDGARSSGGGARVEKQLLPASPYLILPNRSLAPFHQ
jgi:hypothetical protein